MQEEGKHELEAIRKQVETFETNQRRHRDKLEHSFEKLQSNYEHAASSPLKPLALALQDKLEEYDTLISQRAQVHDHLREEKEIGDLVRRKWNLWQNGLAIKEQADEKLKRYQEEYEKELENERKTKK